MTTDKEPAMQTNHSALLTTPAIGSLWQGQGGIYGGIRQDDNGELYHLIFATEDVGEHAWGEYGTSTTATSKSNGLVNTKALLDYDSPFPAAQAASQYTADGHQDFFLPSIGELHQGWQNIAEHFKRTWYWSSSQRSAYSAFHMYFDDGDQDNDAKLNELHVRPVRRLPIR